MKIAILSKHFLETSIPLAKHLGNLDTVTKVELISILPIADRNSFAIDFTNQAVKSGFNDNLSINNESKHLQEYLKNISFKCFFYNSGKYNLFADIKLAYQLSLYLRKEQFQVIHLIGTSPFMFFLYVFLGKKVTAYTLHEVTNHETSTPIITRLILNKLIKQNTTNIIVHSHISKERLLKYADSESSSKLSNRIHVINFGLFETYKSQEDTEFVTKKEKMLLFFGRITAYKGVDYLVAAFKKLRSVDPDVELTIAGNGELNPEIKEIAGITVINRILSNEDIVKLNKMANIVICPYTTASQSGIPMVSYLFENPIIATNIGALPEIIEHMKTGLIIPPKDSDALFEAIKMILRNKQLQNVFRENIKYKYITNKESEFSWNKIAEKTYQLYETQR
jgi:glycosyltransferase involved in cell wall biosynthesis